MARGTRSHARCRPREAVFFAYRRHSILDILDLHQILCRPEPKRLRMGIRPEHSAQELCSGEATVHEAVDREKPSPPNSLASHPVNQPKDGALLPLFEASHLSYDNFVTPHAGQRGRWCGIAFLGAVIREPEA